ncbi:Uncharacterised protein [Vibrio cholerae]|nr:Uncharacterised protein [Vibrio cholerae]
MNGAIISEKEMRISRMRIISKGSNLFCRKVQNLHSN